MTSRQWKIISMIKRRRSPCRLSMALRTIRRVSGGFMRRIGCIVVIVCMASVTCRRRRVIIAVMTIIACKRAVSSRNNIVIIMYRKFCIRPSRIGCMTRGAIRG